MENGVYIWHTRGTFDNPDGELQPTKVGGTIIVMDGKAFYPNSHGANHDWAASDLKNHVYIQNTQSGYKKVGEL